MMVLYLHARLLAFQTIKPVSGKYYLQFSCFDLINFMLQITLSVVTKKTCSKGYT